MDTNRDLSKFAAECGIASRRQTQQDSKSIVSRLKNAKRPENTRVWAHNKMSGTIVSRIDPHNRISAVQMVASQVGISHVIPIGRLDYASKGLLLFTNNGELASAIALPKNKVIRKYSVVVVGQWHLARARFMKAVERGFEIVNGERYSIVSASIIHERAVKNNKYAKTKSKVSISISLAEGKNREIRKLFASFCMFVEELIREQYGPIHLRKLKMGHTEELKEFAVAKLLKICGLQDKFKNKSNHQEPDFLSVP